ncbi:MAG: S-layer homology domain-containing protein [Clostridia bacterium]|nr:S-layer homology domain-containing protein [Clostridia bacterium]
MRKVLASFLICLMLLTAVPFAAEASTYNPFYDVAAGTYYYDAVLWAVDEKITLGVGSGRFDPQGSCTRAQAVTFLWRAAGSPMPTDRRNPFGDVTPAAYYYTALLWAVEQGLTNGVLPGVFGADQQCTRAQIATFLYRLTDDAAIGAGKPFSDVAAGSYYYNAVLWAVKNGITNGMGSGKFAPDQPCTRGQIVTFMHRGKGLFEPPIAEEPEEEPEEEPKEEEKEEVVVLPEGAWRFHNPYDGYSLMIGEEFYVDLSLAGVVAKLYNVDTVIEIYKQSLANMSADYYTNQLYTFLGNTTDHTLTLQETRTYGGRAVKVTAWHRDALSKVEGDKNYYLYFDVVEADAVYSIYIKSAKKAAPEKYCYLAQTLELFAPTKKAPTFHSAPVQKQWSEETAAFYEAYYGAAAEQTWGIMEPTAAKNGDFTVVDAYEDALNYDFSVLSTYSGFSNESLALLDQRLQNAWADGKVLQLSIQPDGAKGNILYEILQGMWDDVLDVYVQKIQAFGHPVMVRLMNEMNGNWCNYSGVFSANDTLIYKEAYRYIYHRFEDAGVDNVLWIWNPNGVSFPTVDWNHTLMYYPGDEYVDIVGLTEFNTGTYYASAGETWRDFTTLYKDLYNQYCQWFEHPLMLTGFACAEMGGDKRAWTEDMFQKIGDYDRAKVLIWWDSVDYDVDDPQIIARDYRIRGENVDIFDLFMKYIGTPDPIVPEEPDPEEPTPPDPEDPNPEEPTPTDPEEPTPTDPEEETPSPAEDQQGIFLEKKKKVCYNPKKDIIPEKEAIV